jgi:ComF family protein
MRSLVWAVSRLLDVLAPPTCAACDAAARAVFCDACARGLRSDDSDEASLDGVPLVAAGRYAEPLSTAVVRLKYEGRAELACSLAQLMAPRLRSLELPSSTLLVPVPLHAKRLASRGYNQAALLAQALASRVGLPCAPRLLLRTRETQRQVGQSRELRLTNAQGAFELNPRVLTRRSGRGGVVLIDDVVTTGSTVRACAQALAAGGVALLAVAAVARADAG